MGDILSTSDKNFWPVIDRDPRLWATYNVMNFVFTVGFIGLGVAAIKRLPLHYVAYIFAVLLLPLSTPSTYVPLFSMPRFVLTAFPAFILLAIWGEKNRWVDMLITVTSLALLGFFVAKFVVFTWVSARTRQGDRTLNRSRSEKSTATGGLPVDSGRAGLGTGWPLAFCCWPPAPSPCRSSSRLFIMDDTVFVWLGQEKLNDPLALGFPITATRATSFRSTSTPTRRCLPVTCRCSSGLSAGVSEPGLHLGFIIFPALAAVSMFFLARRFTGSPLMAALLLIVTPGFMVMTQSVMTDVPALSSLAGGDRRFRLRGRP